MMQLLPFWSVKFVIVSYDIQQIKLLYAEVCCVLELTEKNNDLQILFTFNTLSKNVSLYMSSKDLSDNITETRLQ